MGIKLISYVSLPSRGNANVVCNGKVIVRFSGPKCLKKAETMVGAINGAHLYAVKLMESKAKMNGVKNGWLCPSCGGGNAPNVARCGCKQLVTLALGDLCKPKGARWTPDVLE